MRHGAIPWRCALPVPQAAGFHARLGGRVWGAPLSTIIKKRDHAGGGTGPPPLPFNERGHVTGRGPDKAVM